MVTARSPLKIGDFVCADEEAGIGQVERLEAGTVEIRYFQSPARPDAHREVTTLDEVRSVSLDTDDECFVPAGRSWRAGYVVGQSDDRYRVRTASGEDWYAAADLRVRWARCIGQVFDDLITAQWSEPASVARRSAFLDMCERQRRSARAITSLPSMAAEIHAHQVNVARKVLDDPIGRFLLADEVGLGKTVEALIVIRQLLIDSPEASVRIIVPRHLQRQWTDELAVKAFIGPDGDFAHARVEVRPHHELASWKGEPVDLLVIDEAHRLAAGQHSGDPRDRLTYVAARQRSKDTERVLLLSATPSLHDPRTFLALLHLLDPERHDLRNRVGFQKKLDQREAVAAALLAIDLEDPPVLQAEAIGELADVVGDHTAFAERLRRFAERIEDGSVDDAERRIDAIKAALAERLRVDHRMLRTRRPAVERRFPVRGRTAGAPLLVESGEFAEADVWFERWRVALIADYEDAADAQVARLSRVVQFFADVTCCAPGLLKDAVVLRQNPGHMRARQAVQLDDETLTVLDPLILPIGTREAAELQRVPVFDGAIPEAVAETVARELWSAYHRSARIVVTSAHTAVARQLAERLRTLYSPHEVVSYLSTTPPRLKVEAVRRFSSDEDPRHVIVCDRAAEEGLNLQQADVLILLDLVLSPNSLEQRIGRVDRHATGTAHEKGKVLVHVLNVGPGAELRSATERLMREGLGIFDQSIAALQLTVAEQLPAMREALLRDGARGLDDVRPQLITALREGRRELTRADLLDADPLDEVAEAIVDEIAADDAAATQWRRTIDDMFAEHVGLIPRRDSAGSPPRDEPRLSADVYEHNSSAAFAEAGIGRRTTVSRDVALRTEGVRLLRVGNPLVDATERFLRERGLAHGVTAIRRLVHTLPGGRPEAGFVFVFATNVDLPPQSRSWYPALRRRLASLIPERRVSLAVAADGAVLEDDDPLARILLRPYATRDVAVVERDTQRLRSIVGAEWDEVCHRAVAAAERAAKASLGLEPDELLDAVNADYARRDAVLVARSAPQRLRDHEGRMKGLLESAVAGAELRMASAWLIAVESDVTGDS